MCRPITTLGCMTFFNMFESFDWCFLDRASLGGNNKFERFHDIFMACFEKCFPERKQCVRKSDLGVRWFDNSLREERQRYQLVCDLYAQLKTDDLLALKRQSRAAYRQSLVTAKINASSKFIDCAANKTKAMWTVIRSCRGTDKQPSINLNPNILNAHFIQQPEIIVGALPVAAMLPLDLCDLSGDAAAGFSLSKISNIEVRDLITKLKSGGARDIYGINSKFVKRNISLFVPLLTKLINSTIETGEFPDHLKVAYVVPVHKGGDVNDVGNYRPISILPIVSKVYERAIYNQIVKHCELSNIFYNHQYGFRKLRSTGDAVLEFTNCCLEAFESGDYCLSIFLDLSRAFDCVSHKILLTKLSTLYGFNRETVTLLGSYLTERRQYVRGGPTGMSDSMTPSRGVPQGSILGPLMFILFFNDFPGYVKVADCVECILYADDSTIMVRGSNLNDIFMWSDRVMERVKNWTISNELSLNQNKTVDTLFGLRRLNFENPPSVKFLGVCIDPPLLKFDNHTDMMGSRVNRNIFFIYYFFIIFI